MEEERHEMIIVTWVDGSNRKNYEIFNWIDDINRSVKETEKFCKELWQKSALSDNSKDKIKSMTVVRGRSVRWDKKEEMVVKEFKLKTKLEETES